MSTRAIYTFKANPAADWEQDWNVYKHHDGYPSGAAQHLLAALPFAWKLPRYESNEFAAAFIAGNKPHWNETQSAIEPEYLPGGSYHSIGAGGGVRLMPQGAPLDVANKNCSDIEYRYEIEFKKNDLYVTAFKIGGIGKLTEKKLFTCKLSEMPAKAKD